MNHQTRLAAMMLMLASPALWAGDRVFPMPANIEIASPEGCVEFKSLGLRAHDGLPFQVKGLRAEHNLVNVNGAVGVRVQAQGFLVYLASTLKPGRYTDTIVFELEDKNQPILRVPVVIDVQAPSKAKDGKAASVVVGEF